MTIAKFCLLLTCLLPAVCSIDYCNKTLCGTSQHIACNNSGNFASICSNPKIITITPKLRQQIVKKHNALRNKIAEGFNIYSPASRMATMVWNEELAKIATYNVKQCQMKHDACRNTNKFIRSGQNLSITTWKGSTKTVASIIKDHIQSWFNEYKLGSMDVIKSYAPNGKKIGHFTSMVQDKSTNIGCAISRYNSNGSNVQLMACNYAYTNVISKPVYITGKAASKCTTGVNTNFPSLCSTKENILIRSTF